MMKLFSAVAAAILIYFLSAPPIMIAAFKSKGTFPAIYRPIDTLITSDFNGPIMWYFNDVWHAEIMLIGDVETPWYMILLYTVLGLGLLSVVSLPFIQRFRDHWRHA